MNFANINHCWGSLIIEELSRLGVDYFCVAPGSRSSPLVIALAQNKKLKSFVHYDERGLAFHAMGYSASTKKPAVLISTSGTAAADFFPAVIEASKKKLPLIVVTADRPPELRQTGAAQTIDQVGLFGKYTQWATDMPCPDANIAPQFVLTTIDQAVYQAVRHRGVVHINCMFRQPLTMVKTSGDLKIYTKPLGRWARSHEPYTDYVAGFESAAVPSLKRVGTRLDAIKRGLIVVGKISGTNEAQLVLQLSEKLGWPIFADISSGLRLGQNHSHLIHYFDHLLLSDKLQNKLYFDGVLHLGGRMTSVRYYDLIHKQKPLEYIMVLDHALRNDPNHQVTLRIESSVGNFIKTVIGLIKQRKQSSALKVLSKANQITDKLIEKYIFEDGRLSEPCVARMVSQLIPEDQGLFLSNSMPIRDMSNYADFKASRVCVNGNRGASGIDGIIASAAGYASGLQKPVTLMIGDLAALHDLNSLGMLRGLSVPLIIVLLNNGGGGIFSFLPIADFKEGFEKFWGTPHSFSLAGAAAMFELNYSQPMDAVHFKKVYMQALKSQTSTIIEIITSREENLKVHRLMEDVIKESMN
ncbi:MAG: 2-succinyl-5-enolpyruvyl-6-hydroxy-3-cyclohexene-1-carboxylic-acid synthase [Candidatus Omnitrophica bacterium]|nr:2-succinyl-5-enolpyruvyl-6-hydroxy-3-cyclohexene-1-carboxylic-acid synthase [Candidatus Omnitrophota bacterium]